MFVNDLIIVTRVTRVAARNCKLCLDIYRDLTGQKVNHSKSTVHFPNWLNKNLRVAINSSLGMNVGPFQLFRDPHFSQKIVRLTMSLHS